MSQLVGSLDDDRVCRKVIAAFAVRIVDKMAQTMGR